MNYLTNYYKNLSEQLQARANYLENQVRMINEAMTTYNTGYGSGRRVAGPADSFARPGQSIPGDYNGDGLVTGADLGLALGQNQAATNVTSNWGGQFGGAYAPVSAQSSSTSRGRRSVAGEADAFSRPSGGLAGDLNNDGVVNGADLGLQLGGGQNASSVINNWSMGYNQAGPATYRTTPQINRNRARGVVGNAEGPAAGSRFGSPESAGPGVNYPSVAGDAGPGVNYPSVAGDAGSGAPQTQGGQGGVDLPPLTDLNGDGIINGFDLGLYISTYGAAPPGFGTGQSPSSWTNNYGVYGVGDTVINRGGGPSSNNRRRTVR
jgi:hypothetical protein